MYVFNEHTKRVYLFSDTARDFWLANLTHNRLDECIASLCDTYGSEFREEITEDLLSFISELEQYGLIQSFVGGKNGEL